MPTIQLVAIAILGVITLAVAVGLYRQTRRTAALTLTILAMVAVFYLSGNNGSADPMRHWFESWGLSASEANKRTFEVRKTIHFSFYGAVMLCWRSLSGRNFALAFTMTGLLAAYDEWSQHFAASRGSSAFDWVLDMAGAVTFWTLAEAIHRARGPQVFAPDAAAKAWDNPPNSEG